MSESEWNGEGWPSDGVECEISNCGGPWEWCKIRYMGRHLCVVDHKSHADQHYHLSSVKFRPLQSERDKVTAKAWEIMNEAHDGGMGCMANALYDAGMLVDGEAKRITREEANHAMSEALRDVYFTVRHRTALLDALGFKESGNE